MADTSKAPRMIHAHPEADGPCKGWAFEGWWHVCAGANGPGVEYVRADLYDAAQAEVAKLRAECEQGQRDYCDLMTRHDAHFVAWQSARAEVARLTAALAELRGIAERLPAGVWETWTACSYRRITARGGPDGGVLHAHKHRSDGHPDLSWTEAQCRAACDLVNAVRALPLPPRERDGQEGE